jgi:hypothetical protein
MTGTDIAIIKATPAQKRAWEARGAELRTAVMTNVWAIADWYNDGAGYGFAERASRILDGLYSAQSLQNMGDIAHSFPQDKRNLKVSMGVHKVLAPLTKRDMDEAVKMLASAARGNWTVAKATEEYRKARGLSAQTVANSIRGTNWANAAQHLSTFTEPELITLFLAVRDQLEALGIELPEREAIEA